MCLQAEWAYAGRQSRGFGCVQLPASTAAAAGHVRQGSAGAGCCSVAGETPGIRPPIGMAVLVKKWQAATDPVKAKLDS